MPDRDKIIREPDVIKKIDVPEERKEYGQVEPLVVIAIPVEPTPTTPEPPPAISDPASE